MVLARYCKQRNIPFFAVYRWWELKLKYCPVKAGLRYTDDLNPCSVRVTNTSRKGNLLSCSFSIVNCIDGWIEFTWSSNIWTSSWWGQRMNVSSTYLSHIDGFSDVDPNAISSKLCHILIQHFYHGWYIVAIPDPGVVYYLHARHRWDREQSRWLFMNSRSQKIQSLNLVKVRYPVILCLISRTKYLN